MNEDITRQVKLAREMIAKLNSDDRWRDEQAVWIGRLESRLELLCDAIEAETTALPPKQSPSKVANVQVHVVDPVTRVLEHEVRIAPPNK